MLDFPSIYVLQRIVIINPLVHIVLFRFIFTISTICLYYISMGIIVIKFQGNVLELYNYGKCNIYCLNK